MDCGVFGEMQKGGTMSYNLMDEARAALANGKLVVQNEQTYSLEQVTEQPYDDASFSAGLVKGHEHDTVYFTMARRGEPETTVLLRNDEALALIWVLSGALWSEQIQD